MASSDVILRLRADFGELERELRSVSERFERLERTTSKSFSGISGTLKGIGGAVASAFAVDQIGDFLVSTTTAASDISALGSQYEQVLGGMKGAADQYLSGISQQYNVHTNDLKGTFVQYQALLKGKGLSEKDAFEVSKQYLERTVDAAAFNNGTMAENTDRFMAMIKGEYDSVDTAMVNLSATMLNDIAQKEYGKKFEDLSVSQQEYLKTSVALKQHTQSGVLDQGIRESESFQVTLNRLKSTYTDFLAKVGDPIIKELAPIFADLTESISSDAAAQFGKQIGDLVVNCIELAPKIMEIGKAITPLVVGFVAAIGVFQGLTMISGLIGLFTTFMGAIRGVTIAETILNAVMLANPFVLIAAAIGVLVALGVALWMNWDTVSAKAQQLWSVISSAFGSMVSYLGGVFSSIGSTIGSFFTTVGSAIGSAISGYISIFVGFWSAVGSAIASGFQFIANLFTVGIMFIGSILSLLVQIWLIPFNLVWQNIKQYVIPVFTEICTFLSTKITEVATWFGSQLSAIGNWFTSIFSAVSSFVASVFAQIKANIINPITAAVQGVIAKITAMYSAFMSILGMIKAYVVGKFNEMKAQMVAIISAAASMVANKFSEMKQGIQDKISGIVSSAKSGFERVKSAIMDPINKAKDQVGQAIEKMKSYFRTTFPIPNIKLPHLSVSGKFSMNPPSVPNFNIKWFETGGIFTGASVVGIGENGDEAVVPLSNKKRMKPFADAVASMINTKDPQQAAAPGGVTINVANMVIREETDIKRVAEELNRLQVRESRKKGLV